MNPDSLQIIRYLMSAAIYRGGCKWLFGTDKGPCVAELRTSEPDATIHTIAYIEGRSVDDVQADVARQRACALDVHEIAQLRAEARQEAA